MGKVHGFLDYPREGMVKEEVEVRKKHYTEFEKPLPKPRLKTQAARCMSCGVPYCNWGCPVNNLIPEFNDFVYNEQWQAAYGTLQSTNNFPEFTGRICPAPCEPACTVDIVETPVTIKQIELAIIENAFSMGLVRANKNIERNGNKVAIIGSGPAGLAAATQLNLAGYSVTIFEKSKKAGGLLRYGIPDFKLEKRIVDRRLHILREEKIEFRLGCEVGGAGYSIDELQKNFDAICLCCGAEEPRPAEIAGVDKEGIHYAMNFLTQQNKVIGQEAFDESQISAKNKHVVVIGCGDTGSDCVGTGIRQGCKSMTQIQIHKEPPRQRYDNNPWPFWPKTFSTSSSQEEGCLREFSALAREAIGNGKIEKLLINRLIWPEGPIASGNRDYKVHEEQTEIPCDLLLIALGFKHCYHQGLVEEFELETDERGNVAVNDFRTSREGVYAAGDMVEGANLVVTAIASGRGMARAVDEAIKGYSHLS